MPKKKKIFNHELSWLKELAQVKSLDDFSGWRKECLEKAERALWEVNAEIDRIHCNTGLIELFHKAGDLEEIIRNMENGFNKEVIPSTNSQPNK